MLCSKKVKYILKGSGLCISSQLKYFTDYIYKTCYISRLALVWSQYNRNTYGNIVTLCPENQN